MVSTEIPGRFRRGRSRCVRRVGRTGAATVLRPPWPPPEPSQTTPQRGLCQAAGGSRRPAGDSWTRLGQLLLDPVRLTSGHTRDRAKKLWTRKRQRKHLSHDGGRRLRVIDSRLDQWRSSQGRFFFFFYSIEPTICHCIKIVFVIVLKNILCVYISSSFFLPLLVDVTKNTLHLLVLELYSPGQ